MVVDGDHRVTPDSAGGPLDYPQHADELTVRATIEELGGESGASSSKPGVVTC